MSMPCPSHAPTMPFFSRPQHGRLSTAVLWPWEERHVQSMTWAWHGKCESDTPHCVNQMGKTHSNHLAVRHGRGTACYVWIGLKWVLSANLGRTGGLWWWMKLLVVMKIISNVELSNNPNPQPQCLPYLRPNLPWNTRPQKWPKLKIQSAIWNEPKISFDRLCGSYCGEPLNPILIAYS